MSVAFEAAMRELEAQRDMLGERAAKLAAKLAVAQAENEDLRASVTRMAHEASQVMAKDDGTDTD